MSNFDRPRRLVAAQRSDGTSYFVEISDVEQVDYAKHYRRHAAASQRWSDIYRLWAADHLPVELPSDGRSVPIAAADPGDVSAALRGSSPHPPDGDGFRISMIRMYPRPDGGANPVGLHWHDTFDCQCLVEGRLEVTMDDGSTVLMEPGDSLLQFGTNHAWRVVGDTPAVILLFMLGARRVGRTPPADRQVVARP
ncbi:MAG TPA: cupin domain-containing protein [Ilumatobacter sp.]|nr:cupin domain-containing protein [Ilumatobacter sp.]